MTFQWDFGDNSGVVTDTNPTYVYSTTGFFTVTLTATNPVSSSVFMDLVEITEPPPPPPPTYVIFMPAVIELNDS